MTFKPFITRYCENNCLVVPTSVTQIRENDLLEYKNIEKILFLGDVELPSNIFYNCRSLKEVVFEGKANFESFNNTFNSKITITFTINNEEISFEFSPPNEKHLIYINGVPDFEGTSEYIRKLFISSKNEILDILEDEMCIGIYTSFFILRVLEQAYGQDSRIDELFHDSYSEILLEYIEANNLTEDKLFIKSHS